MLQPGCAASASVKSRSCPPESSDGRWFAQNLVPDESLHYRPLVEAQETTVGELTATQDAAPLPGVGRFAYLGGGSPVGPAHPLSTQWARSPLQSLRPASCPTGALHAGKTFAAQHTRPRLARRHACAFAPQDCLIRLLRRDRRTLTPHTSGRGSANQRLLERIAGNEAPTGRANVGCAGRGLGTLPRSDLTPLRLFDAAPDLFEGDGARGASVGTGRRLTREGNWSGA